jgi:DNA helicase HerA-like ATPase
MEYIIGHDLAAKLLSGVDQPVVWDPLKTINPHCMLLGMSGAGKTHTIRELISAFSGSETAPKIHVFDVHGDIEVPGSTDVLYSEQSGFGINPLEINPDQHFGGVRKRIESFIRTVEKSTSPFGVRQVAVLRSLMEELYLLYGFKVDDPETWNLDQRGGGSSGIVFLDVPYADRDEAKKHGARWNPAAKCWYIKAVDYHGAIASRFALREEANMDQQRRQPTLHDLVNFTYSKMEEAFIGVGREAMLALQDLHRATSRLNKTMAKVHYGRAELSSEETDKLEKLKERVRETVEGYLARNATDRTLKDAMLYSSYDLLSGIYQRLLSLEAAGVFRDTPPPFDRSRSIFRHVIKPLSREEQKMFVLFSLERIFERAMQRGEQDQVRTVVVLDEVARYVDRDPTNPINIIATEGRKFGLALICAGQNPEHFTRDFLSSVATKMVLGIDESFWDGAKRYLNIPRERLTKIQPRRNLLVQIKTSESAAPEWLTVAKCA